MPATSPSGRLRSSIRRGQIGALGFENLRESSAAFGEMAVDGPPVAGEMLGDAIDRAFSARQELAYRFAHLAVPGLASLADGVDPVLHIARDQRV